MSTPSRANLFHMNLKSLFLIFRPAQNLPMAHSFLQSQYRSVCTITDRQSKIVTYVVPGPKLPSIQLPQDNFLRALVHALELEVRPTTLRKALEMIISAQNPKQAASTLQESFKIPPSILTSIALHINKLKVAMKQNQNAWDPLSTLILRTTSLLGDRHATFHLVRRNMLHPTSLKEKNESTQRFRKLVEERQPDALEYKATLVLQSGKKAESLEFYRLAMDAGNGNAALILAKLLKEDSRAAEAQEAFRKAAQLGMKRAHLHLALLAKDTGDKIHHFEEAAKDGSALASHFLTALYTDIGNTKMAQEWRDISIYFGD
ncbi:hypothetical protein NEOLI_001704 [Neolecta irregularis DAH-3]|uniref:Uncharacterized protein n=1 Tax=Neolecta irregularis (strain DAH-3) TaxID=1198029 RepID=A0A1U7LJJ6_NEOID|nr:hypothetical protein NEOLI_001704 [Neolecta irregularis DAH-3]|eukprot:OLL22836.1 hypothetical protein NEOLI_001704 [Neolecta irregularis DAH-3]